MIHPLFKPHLEKMFPLDTILKDKVKRLGETNEKIDCRTLLLRDRLESEFAEKLHKLGGSSDGER